METCGRCGGSGRLSIKLGRPDPSRDTHETYRGPWCIYPESFCFACQGSGMRRAKDNTVAGYRIHLDADGMVVSKQRIGDT